VPSDHLVERFGGRLGDHRVDSGDAACAARVGHDEPRAVGVQDLGGFAEQRACCGAVEHRAGDGSGEAVEQLHGLVAGANLRIRAAHSYEGDAARENPCCRLARLDHGDHGDRECDVGNAGDEARGNAAQEAGLPTPLKRADRGGDHEGGDRVTRRDRQRRHAPRRYPEGSGRAKQHDQRSAIITSSMC
jgi:hypothetical protein